MIRLFKKTNHTEFINLLDFIKTIRDRDFYNTRNNNRIYINTEKDLNNFGKDCSCILVSEEKNNINGVLAIWEGFGKGVKRPYIKLSAQTYTIADKLLQVLLWNYNQEFFVKLYNRNKFKNLFLNRGFRFKHGRGQTVILKRNKDFKYKKEKVDKDEL